MHCQQRIVLTIIVIAYSFLSPESIKSAQNDHTFSQQEIVDEANRLITTMPTGFTYLAQSGISNVKALAGLSVQMAMHPINTTIDISSTIGRKAQDITKGGFKKGFYVASHPLAIPKKTISIVRHPVQETKNFLTFCDNIDFKKFPIMGTICRVSRQFFGLVPITAENCPELYTMLQTVAQKLGVEVTDIYIFKGNFWTKILESFQRDDFSCNAFQTGFTSKTSYIVIGKDLLLGVNRGSNSFVPGLKLEQIQAVFAHELSHQKNRDVLKLVLARAASDALLLVAQYLIFTKLIIPCGDKVIRINALGRDIIWPISVNVLIYKLLGEYVVQLLSCAYSRKCEKNADINAACALETPSSLAKALIKMTMLYETKHRALAQLFKDHPDDGARLAYMNQLETERK